MSAKWLSTFKHFKFPLLPLLTHSGLMANACIGNAHFVQLVQSKLSTTDEMKYYQNHLVSHIYTIKILEQTDLLTFGCCLFQYIISSAQCKLGPKTQGDLFKHKKLFRLGQHRG